MRIRVLFIQGITGSIGHKCLAGKIEAPFLFIPVEIEDQLTIRGKEKFPGNIVGRGLFIHLNQKNAFIPGNLFINLLEFLINVIGCPVISQARPHAVFRVDYHTVMVKEPGTNFLFYFVVLSPDVLDFIVLSVNRAERNKRHGGQQKKQEDPVCF
jgi:hypothetical protein